MKDKLTGQTNKLQRQAGKLRREICDLDEHDEELRCQLKQQEERSQQVQELVQIAKDNQRIVEAR